jgi:hypothetical protein
MNKIFCNVTSFILAERYLILAERYLIFAGMCSLKMDVYSTLKTEAVGTTDHTPVFCLSSSSIKMDPDYIQRLSSYEYVMLPNKMHFLN